MAGRRSSEITCRVNRDMVARCRNEGIAIAFAWVPESPRYREAYGPAGPLAIAEHTRFPTEGLRVNAFPAPGNLAEEDFSDGYHLMRHGAAKYSRWLAEMHLKPWLASHSSLSSGRER